MVIKRKISHKYEFFEQLGRLQRMMHDILDDEDERSVEKRMRNLIGGSSPFNSASSRVSAVWQIGSRLLKEIRGLRSIYN
jgi:hypothetical protein